MPLHVPFVPPRWLAGGHRQTFWANYAPRPRVALAAAHALLIPTTDGDRIQAFWHRHAEPRAVLVILHGLTGCAASRQVTGLAAKAFRRGYDAVRVDLRNASGPVPSLGIGHAGRSEDVRSLVQHLHEAGARRVIVAGYSLGGNIALKALGEQGPSGEPTFIGGAVVSVPLDLAAACASIDGPGNGVYRRYFLHRMQRSLAARAGRAPERYRGVSLSGHRTLRGFDNDVVAPLCGFDSAADYYDRCSAARFVGRIAVPTLAVHALDDPFVPADEYRSDRLVGNPHVQVLLPRRGGHAGFYGVHRESEDRFWAENRILEFCDALVAAPS